jgi:GxxExxY protein
MEGSVQQKLLYPELSYRIVGILFKVQNELPSGYQEKHVQRAVAVSLLKNKIVFRQQVMTTIEYEGRVVGRYLFDFIVGNKIVVELKVSEKLSKKDFDQIKQYLERSDLKLGLLARFGQKGVRVYRVLKPTNNVTTNSTNNL